MHCIIFSVSDLVEIFIFKLFKNYFVVHILFGLFSSERFFVWYGNWKMHDKFIVFVCF